MIEKVLKINFSLRERMMINELWFHIYSFH